MPQALKKSGARYAFLGVPFDEGNIGKPGSEEGPREFRLASQEYFTYWFEYNVDLYGNRRRLRRRFHAQGESRTSRASGSIARCAKC